MQALAAQIQNEGKEAVLPVASREIKSLTSLRFFAACPMVYYHMRGCFSWWPDFSASFAVEHVVTVFFILSGFILTQNYFNLKDARSTCYFYLARVGRIWPAHMISLFLLVFLIPELFKVKGSNFVVFLSNLFMVHSWIPSYRFYFSYNAPSWTNSTEILFYLFFPLLLWGVKRNWYVPLLATFSISLGLALMCNWLQLPEYDPVKPCAQAFTYIHPLSQMFEFTVGICTALLFRRYFAQASWGRLRTTVLEISLLALFLFINLNTPGWRMETISWAGNAGSLWIQNVASPVLPVAAFILILATEKGLLARILNWRALVFLGEISFAVYMIHAVLIVYKEVYYPQHQSVYACLTFLAVILLAAHFMWWAIERPFRRIILKAGTAMLPFQCEPAAEPAIIRQMRAKSASSRASGKLVWLAAFEAVLLALLFYFSLPATDRVSGEEAQTLSTQSPVRDIQFKPYLQCRSAQARPHGSQVAVTLVWESLTEQRLDFLATVCAYDKSGNLSGQMSYALAPRLEHVPAGTLWRDNFEVRLARPLTEGTVAITLARAKKHPVFVASEKSPGGILPSMIVPFSKSDALSGQP